jgi:hypothetical protein
MTNSWRCQGGRSQTRRKRICLSLPFKESFQRITTHEKERDRSSLRREVAGDYIRASNEQLARGPDGAGYSSHNRAIDGSRRVLQAIFLRDPVSLGGRRVRRTGPQVPVGRARLRIKKLRWVRTTLIWGLVVDNTSSRLPPPLIHTKRPT